ncbi:MAG: hypothetical protein PWQ82_1460 [Thermosediminibacterales bacterium]|nr:hypothetical protein [Thermosediminibacterales bacterium]
MKQCNIGGQAVIEGVMMRSPKKTAIAVRKPDNSIFIYKEPTRSLSERFKFLKLPVLRGMLALIESLVVGIRALSFSAQQAGEEGEELTTKDVIIAVVSAVVFGVGIFMILPTIVAKFIHGVLSNTVLLNLIEGVVRLSIFLLYVVMISRMKDIQRVFQYHGAEHKSIHCLEAEEELKVENVRKYSTLHPRCGTSFLLIVMLVSIMVFSFLGWPNLLLRIVSRLLLFPLVAGVSYEIIKYAGRSNSPFIKTINAPGLWLQKLTTREPDDSQIEVAIEALKEVR